MIKKILSFLSKIDIGKISLIWTLIKGVWSKIKGKKEDDTKPVNQDGSESK